VNSFCARTYGSITIAGFGRRRRRIHHQMNRPTAMIAAMSARIHQGNAFVSQMGRAGFGTRSALSAGSTERTNIWTAATSMGRFPRLFASDDVTVMFPMRTGCVPTSQAARR
jgi:hypothetical protein